MLAPLREELADNPPPVRDMRAEYQKSIIPIGEMRKMEIPPREPIMGKWFLQGDLGFIFAPRGVGKTWLAMALATSIAEGRGLWTWEVNQPRRVLYVDGEMAFDATKQRSEALSKSEGGDLHFLHHEQMFQKCGQVLNLTDRESQSALLEHCIEQKIEVIVFDNLSCLFSGMKENDADSWEKVLPWLLNFRRNKIAVIFVHHAGRNGAMRGTSRREDAAFWVIQLSEAREVGEERQGARFISKFTKNRNTTDEQVPHLEWDFREIEGGKIEIGTKILSDLNVFRDYVESGLTSASDIAEEMGVSKGTVSKLAKKAMFEGWLTKDGREYKLVAR